MNARTKETRTKKSDDVQFCYWFEQNAVSSDDEIKPHWLKIDRSGTNMANCSHFCKGFWGFFRSAVRNFGTLSALVCWLAGCWLLQTKRNTKNAFLTHERSFINWHLVRMYGAKPISLQHNYEMHAAMLYARVSEWASATERMGESSR